MTLAPAICPRCQQPFQRKRQSQRTCSKACKQATFRGGKCNAATTIPATPAIAPDGSTGQVSERLTRMWPGNKPLSDLECRVMRVTPTSHRDKRGALLYQSTTNENGPASAATDPDLGSKNHGKVS